MSSDNFDTLDGAPTIPGEPGGQVLSGRYKIVREIGSGGMGTVYLALDLELDIEVAIKVLPTLLANNKRAIDNLRREAKTALKLSHPNIVSVARGFQPIWDRIQTATPRWQGQQPGEETAMQCYCAGYDYFKTWGMELIEGRSFSKAFSTDSSNYLINQTAARIIGLETPVGKQLTVDGVTGEIIGIVKDFHHTSLHNTIQPIIFRVFNAAGMAIKVRSMDEGTLDYIESIWNKAVPNEPFENDYFALKVDAFYEKEEKLATLFNIFTFLAIFISCLGLLGLASFIAESRTKEIGIRKVLGAPVFNLVASLSKEFVLLVAIAIVIAWPVGWWLMNRWLQNFAYRMHHSLLIYVIAAMFAFCMAVMTVSFQAFRAAGANPVKTLRYE